MNRINFKKLLTYIQYIPRIPKIILLIKNWPSYFLNWTNIINTDTTYFFRNGYEIKTTEGIDACTLNAIFIIEIYKKILEDVSHFNQSTIIDLGSNIGLFMIYTKIKIPKTKILCYEPL